MMYRTGAGGQTKCDRRDGTSCPLGASGWRTRQTAGVDAAAEVGVVAEVDVAVAVEVVDAAAEVGVAAEVDVAVEGVEAEAESHGVGVGAGVGRDEE